MLVITLMYADGEWTVEVIDIETAFLEVDLKEEVGSRSQLGTSLHLERSTGRAMLCYC